MRSLHFNIHHCPWTVFTEDKYKYIAAVIMTPQISLCTDSQIIFLKQIKNFPEFSCVKITAQECAGMVCVLFVEQVAAAWDTLICRIWPWKSNWMLLHADATCHSSITAQHFLAKNQIAAVTRLPYSPDLAPCEFWLFHRFATGLKSRRFAFMEWIKQNMSSQSHWIRETPDMLPAMAGLF
jgi:hypothetical protein